MTNDQKRIEAATLVAACKSAGWSTKELALVFASSTGTVASWGRGDSMATNDIRATLATLPAVTDRRAYVASSIQARIDLFLGRAAASLNAHAADHYSQQASKWADTLASI
jgi:hypothetical protein